MKEFYSAYYSTVQHSPAHHAFCERVFGKDLCQHGFADLEQLRLVMDVTQLGPHQRALDLGCGNGMITEYLSDRTGAHITGIDYIPEAISFALQRTKEKSERLSFAVGDINQLELSDHTFDVVLSIDSIYFSQNYPITIQKLKAVLKPGGQMSILYSYGREPWVAKEDFPREKLPADKTPLAEALEANGLKFHTRDLTCQDYELALRRKKVLIELKTQFEAEGAIFIFNNRMGDAEGIIQAVEDGLHARYLYHIQKQ